ncbi:hypothetical protein HNQ58_002271 [Rehaibacterium terrae]|jgi:hypothetical protein|uniref:Uncharacterized protein n=1 Tax=Rehaibacterium terrae TaxID=1341696 RepID=A0A7W7Y1G2_9GAMM|nr:hypothetical protein [Rehaibacterium terrae]
MKRIALAGLLDFSLATQVIGWLLSVVWRCAGNARDARR